MARCWVRLGQEEVGRPEWRQGQPAWEAEAPELLLRQPAWEAEALELLLGQGPERQQQRWKPIERQPVIRW